MFMQLTAGFIRFLVRKYKGQALAITIFMLLIVLSAIAIEYLILDRNYESTYSILNNQDSVVSETWLKVLIFGKKYEIVFTVILFSMLIYLIALTMWVRAAIQYVICPNCVNYTFPRYRVFYSEVRHGKIYVEAEWQCPRCDWAFMENETFDGLSPLYLGVWRRLDKKSIQKNRYSHNDSKPTAFPRRIREVRLADQGHGFHYCPRCKEYNNGSFLNCPLCGNQTIVYHGFKIGDGLLQVGEWFQFKISILPDTTNIEFEFEGNADPNGQSRLFLTLEKENENYWQPIVVYQSVEKTADIGAIARWALTIEDLGYQSPTLLRFKLDNATVRGISMAQSRKEYGILALDTD